MGKTSAFNPPNPVAEESLFGRAGSAVQDYRFPLKRHVDLLPPGSNRRLDGGLLRREGVGQMELSFGHRGLPRPAATFGEFRGLG